MSEIIDPIEYCRGAGSTATIMQPGLKACNRCVINKDGDLLFVASEKFIYGYNLLTEICFRVYEGHEGIVEDLDVDDNSKFLISVAADNQVIVHNIETGERVCTYESRAFMECCSWAPGRNEAVVFSKASKETGPSAMILLRMVCLNRDKGSWKLDNRSIITFPKSMKAVIWPDDNTIICGDEEGTLWKLDQRALDGDKKTNTKTGKIEDFADAVLKKVVGHRAVISNITLSFNKNFFATASAGDTTVKTWDLDLNEIGKYMHNYVVSCAAIAPDAPHIVLASTADHSNIARTNTGSTDFTINFFHLIFQNQFASMKVCKSAVNWVGFTPDGMNIVTTAHEGTFNIIRLGGKYSDMVKEHKKELETLKNEMP